ncbi:MAG: hypothetical protein IPQ19_10370 [Bacteroidetes bacterium]|nr:hypothetical protein [Bacteroidota bacterium]
MELYIDFIVSVGTWNYFTRDFYFFIHFGFGHKKAFVFAIVINSISAGFGFLIHQYSHGKTF